MTIISEYNTLILVTHGPWNTNESYKSYIGLLVGLTPVTSYRHQGAFQKRKSQLSSDKAYNVAVFFTPFIGN